MKVDWKAIYNVGTRIGIGSGPGALGAALGLGMGKDAAAQYCHSIINSCANAPDPFMYGVGGLAVGIVISVVVFKTLF